VFLRLRGKGGYRIDKGKYSDRGGIFLFRSEDKRDELTLSENEKTKSVQVFIKSRFKYLTYNRP